MALIKCPECECTVSDKAEICPHCGFSINNHLRVDGGIGRKIRRVFCFIIIFYIINKLDLF